MSLNKYEEALSKYNTELNDDDVKKAVENLLDKHLAENDNKEVKQFCLNSVELTTLKTTDSEESVLKFVEKVNKFDDVYPELGHVATVCVYPNKIVDLRLYKCKYISGDIFLTAHFQYKFISLSNLLDYDLCPADMSLANYLVNNYKL